MRARWPARLIAKRVKSLISDISQRRLDQLNGRSISGGHDECGALQADSSAVAA